MKIVKLDRLAGLVAALLLVCIASPLFAASELDFMMADAIMKGDTATVSKLLSSGADANVWYGGGPVLMIAAGKGYTDTVKALIKAGADVNAQTENAMTALSLATQNGHTDTASVLRAAGAR